MSNELNSEILNNPKNESDEIILNNPNKDNQDKDNQDKDKKDVNILVYLQLVNKKKNKTQ